MDASSSSSSSVLFVFLDLPENTTPPAPKYVCGCVHVRDYVFYNILKKNIIMTFSIYIYK